MAHTSNQQDNLTGTPVHLHAIIHSANHVVAEQCLKSSRYKVNVRIKHHSGQKCDLRYRSWCGLSISETDDFLGFSNKTLFRV